MTEPPIIIPPLALIVPCIGAALSACEMALVLIVVALWGWE
jgi:hypothetical protein